MKSRVFLIIGKIVFISFIIQFFSCTTTHELTYKSYYPVPQSNQELHYGSGYRFICSDLKETFTSAALNFMDNELFLSVIIINNSNNTFTIDYPNIEIYNEYGSFMSYYTDNEFIQSKAKEIIRGQIQTQALAAYINNEMNAGRLHIANDYVVDKPSDRRRFNERIDYYSEMLFRPKTLKPNDYLVGQIFLKEYSPKIDILIKAKDDYHKFKFELK